MGVRVRYVSMLGLLALLAFLPVIATAAPRWPSGQDVRDATPGLTAKDASCIARYYRGRLTRKAWFTVYFELTAREKLTTDAGIDHCMTRVERIALFQQGYEASFGKHPELRCVARRNVDRSRATRLATTTFKKSILVSERIFRACRFIGVQYGVFAHGLGLVLTPLAQACTNQHGSSYPLRPRPAGDSMDKSERISVGKVLDRCVGRAASIAMWRRSVSRRYSGKAVSCIADHLAANVPFALLLEGGAVLKKTTRGVITACGADVSAA